ncbi:GntR family transcriptional regulator [Bacillus mycoides]|uniref:GntR family transcriptional regulator n=1 Tax=Bacillus TaxID=1386 RepID=UPI000DC2AB35|nr:MULTISPECIES: GntR family transcriptional regulator [Bacillus]MBJ7960530.1 GntR family transcriptional regulator [Bacillus cereus group sp. N28]MDI6529588.1 GntR family transcriptional regulator [Bacillus mycoides]RAN66560.1 GntR family transcriptional regulator [Bacillus sp. SRB_8]WJE56861.1 GntR family transcriptional regulator [Bacillus mycoides]WJE62780.1 GntR family transcriptional regulator [Bacillus mycoides]
MSAKYKQIADVLEQNIRDGLFNETKKLPTEEALMNRFEVSRNTIRKVISQLVNRGYIFQVQGSGMFLRETSVTDYINLGSLRGLTKNLVSQNIETKVLENEVIEANEEIVERMQCEIGTRLYFLKRVRIVDGKPFSIEVSYFKKDIIPYLNEEIALSSVYSYFIEDLRLNIGFADKVISCEKINKENAKLLELNEGDPALLIENTVYLVNGTIFELSQSMFHYEKTKLLNRINFN